MSEPLVVGSEHKIFGTAYDISDGVRTAKDLSGATLSIKASFNGGAALTWPCTMDPDQTANKGKFTSQLGDNDVPSPGYVEMQLWVTLGAIVTKSAIVRRKVERSVS